MIGRMWVRDVIPTEFLSVWIIMADAPDDPVIGWWDGCEWWTFVEGTGPRVAAAYVLGWRNAFPPDN